MRKFVLMGAAVAIAAGMAFVLGGPATSDNGIASSWIAAVAKGQVKASTITVGSSGVTRTLPMPSGATINAAQDAACAAQPVPNCDERSQAADAGSGDPSVDSGLAVGDHTLGCGARDSKGNVRVNQDCTFRRQAEEEIVYNPADPTNLVAGQNDSRVGYNQCGIDFSTNNGTSWGDMLPPFRQRINNPAAMGPTSNPNNNTIGGGPGTFHTYDAGSDPALAVDSQGRAYFSCVVFDVASNATGLYVTQSPRGAQGSFYFNVSYPSKKFMVVEDNNGLVFHDKNFIAADAYPSSPNRDNVYVTWTVFKYSATTGRYQQSPIYGSMSTDHALTWSTPEEISGASDALCFFGNALDPNASPHACNFDQGSDPVVLPNGDLEVVFNNGNTADSNPNSQQLSVHCKPTGSSSAGNAHLNCASPAKVGDDVTPGEPLCNFGRGPEECIPGAYIRTNDFPRINTQNTQNNHLYTTWQDYRNGEFDIQMSTSTDGGLTWHEVGTVNPDRGLDHYFAAVDQTPKGDDHVGVSYYRTERVPGENTTPLAGFAPGTDPGVQQGNSDYVLAGGRAGATPYDFKVVSPVFPPPDGIQAGFNGDYSGLAINQGDEAHPIWSDTRNVDPYAPANGVVHDEDIYTDKVGLPDGKGKPGIGQVGKR